MRKMTKHGLKGSKYLLRLIERTEHENSDMVVTSLAHVQPLDRRGLIH